MTSKKKVSLVVTTYNCKENFLKTYRSICDQTYSNLEIVVVDGNSQDGTKEVIEECAKCDSRIKWISEKDSGIYDAMNKGVKMSSGDIIAVCNDEYTDCTAIEQYVDCIERGNYDGVHSDLVYADQSGNIVRKWKMGVGKIQMGWMPAHPSLFLKREIYEKYGEYKENYKCSADYEFIVRILKTGVIQLGYIPKSLISMFYGGTSSNGIVAYWTSMKESYRALKENNIKYPWWIIGCRILRVLLQFR